MTKSSPSIWHLLHHVKLTVKISSICVAFLEKMNFTQQALMNDFYYFFQGEEYFAHRLWKIAAALSLSSAIL